MKKHYDIVAVGGAVADITFYTNHGRVFRTPENPVEQRMLAFEFGAKIPVSEAHFTIGGGAANTANVFKKLGLEVALLSRLGNDEYGQHIKTTFEKKGIRTEYLQKDDALRTGLSFILCNSKKEHEHIVFSYRGANDNLEITPPILKNIRTRWVYLSSLSGSDWQKDLKNLFACAREKNIKIAWNPGNAQIQAGKNSLEDFLKRTEILIVNKDEAIELVLSGVKIGKRNPRFLNKTLYLLNILNEWGPKIVVITEGAKGANALHEGKFYHTKAVKKKIVNTTGVGDAFGATFVYGILTKHNIPDSLRFASYNSACVLTKIGAQEGSLTFDKLLKKESNQ